MGGALGFWVVRSLGPWGFDLSYAEEGREAEVLQLAEMRRLHDPFRFGTHLGKY